MRGSASPIVKLNYHSVLLLCAFEILDLLYGFVVGYLHLREFALPIDDKERPDRHMLEITVELGGEDVFEIGEGEGALDVDLGPLLQGEEFEPDRNQLILLYHYNVSHSNIKIYFILSKRNYASNS
jgi:hypothetical protein